MTVPRSGAQMQQGHKFGPKRLGTESQPCFYLEQVARPGPRALPPHTPRGSKPGVGGEKRQGGVPGGAVLGGRRPSKGRSGPAPSVPPQDQDASGVSPLHLAARFGHPVLVEWLLRGGHEATLETLEGALPLHHAAVSGDLTCLKLLTAAHRR